MSKKLTFELDEDLHLRLRRVALETGTTVSEILRALIVAHIEKVEKRLGEGEK